VQVNDSTIDGGAPSSTIAHVGIAITGGATGRVTGSLIENNEYTGTASNTEGLGVSLFGGCMSTATGGPLSFNVAIDRNRVVDNDDGINVFQANSQCTASTTTPTDAHIDDNFVAKNDGITNTALFNDQYGNNYSGYQVGIADSGGANDTVADNGARWKCGWLTRSTAS